MVQPSFPSRLDLDVSHFPKLTREQAGHLRHFYNTSAALDGEWPHMGTQEPDQGFLDAYRYQLATMLYATGVTHYHRMPAMRGYFKPLMRRLIQKMLRNEVWSYWYLTSQSGIRIDPDLKELRKPWPDPIVRENIMYSGHLLLMTSLYAMLFNDDEFEKPGSLTFNWDPTFWGMGAEKYEYDNRSLQVAILKEMESCGWAGVCCEPNMIFVVCNQFPLIGIRYNDVRDNVNTIDGVLQKYWAALKEKHMISPDGLYVDWLFLKQGKTMPAQGVGWTAWANAFMNAWNPQFVRDSYESQVLGFITKAAGKIEIQHPAVGSEIRRLVAEDGASANSTEVIAEARHKVMTTDKKPVVPYMQPFFGYVVKWLSELNKTEELNALLTYADRRFDPTWEKGGLYYPRHDQILDEKGEWTFVDPFTGNAAIGYSRLNVEDGQKKMWDHPWTREEVDHRPWVDGIEFSQGLDCLRGQWDEKVSTLVVTLKTWDNAPKPVTFTVKNLPEGDWAVYEEGNLIVVHKVSAGGEVQVSSLIQPKKEVDFVIMK